MKRIVISNLGLYRWRFMLMYSAIIIVFIGVLFLVSLVIPGGINTTETHAVTSSGILSIKNWSPELVINLPYHLLQKSFFALFGVSIFTIKLPTIILATITGIGITLLLKSWFKLNIALLTAILSFSIGPFLLASQLGTPAILYILWPVWIIYSSIKLSGQSKFKLFWAIVFIASIILSMYTPYSVYILIALASTIIFHPHLRFIIKNFNKLLLTLAVIAGLIITAPLVYNIYLAPKILSDLLGLNFSINFLDNIKEIYSIYFNFSNPSISNIIIPVYSLPIMIVVIIGIYRLFLVKYTAKSYILTAYGLIILPLVFLNPKLIYISFVPALILIGYGLEYILKSWYGIFPKNPYARVLGLIPIFILITTVFISNIDRFVYGSIYAYSQSNRSYKDLDYLKSIIKKENTGQVSLIVDDSEFNLYETIRRYNTKWNINNIIKSSELKIFPTNYNVIVTNKAYPKINSTTYPAKIYTDSNSEEADRYYLYKKTEL